jgi:HD-GYP domain-containing protein (c-di-GMP phosphodiesterase class II)
MSALPRPAQLYIWILAGLAVACLLNAVIHFPLAAESVRDYLVFSSFSILAGLFPVILKRRFVEIEITVAMAVDIAALILFPLSLAVLIPATGALATEIIQRRVWYKLMFNVSQVTVAYTVLHGIVSRFYGGQGILADTWTDALGLVVIGVSYYVLNTTLVVLVLALAGGLSFWYIWRTNIRGITWHQVSMVCAGFLGALLWQVQPWSLVLIVLPLAILRRALALTTLLDTQTHEAIEALVDTVDARDPSTYQHSERVANYARAIARAMELDWADVEQIGVSARLHDLGKVGIGDAWLYKAGPLTDEERQQFQRHSLLGADIVSRFPILGVECGLVRSHHEHWNGGGYPDGLKGEEIPLGARIISVADSFDAMTSDRPYRNALCYAEARRRLQAGAGTQWDPAVVAAALKVLPGNSDSLMRVGEQEPLRDGEVAQISLPLPPSGNSA